MKRLREFLLLFGIASIPIVFLFPGFARAGNVPSPVRTWKDDTGQFKTNAILKTVKGDKAILTKADGSEIQVPLERLSKADQHFIKGIQSFDKGNYLDAITSYSSAIAANPKDVLFFINRSAAQYEVGNYDLSMKDARKAIQLDSTSATAFFNLGCACQASGQLEEALEQFSRSIQLHPTYADAYGSRGLVRHDLGDVERAIPDYNRAIQLNPNLVETYFNRARVHSGKGAWNDAIADLSTVLRLNRNDHVAFIERGIAYSMSGESRKAETDFSEAIRLSPTNPLAHYNRGVSRIRSKNVGDIEAGVRDLSTAIRLKQDFIEAYKMRSDGYTRLGQREKAQADLNEAQRLEGVIRGNRKVNEK